MNYGYCDFFLLPDKMRYSDIEHSYILELKYATRTATNAELEAQAEEGRQQLLRYSKDKVAETGYWNDTSPIINSVPRLGYGEM